MKAPAPPGWADAWLRLMLPARDRDTVSGDLLEEYRESVRPRKSRLAADVWYLAQVSRFAWRIGMWALFLAAPYTGRVMWDWFVPTTNFTSRAEVTTLTMISTLLVIGASSTLRTRSVVAGIVSTGSAVLGAAIINAAACGLVYWNWRSPELITAVNGSGGLEEVFTLPIMTIVPGTMIGAIGAYVVSLLRTCHPQS